MCGRIDPGHTYDEYLVLLAKLGMIDCQATWLGIVPLGNRTKEPISSSIHKGNKISPKARLIMCLSRNSSNLEFWYWVCSLQTHTLQ
jgi:hypothetical protein